MTVGVVAAGARTVMELRVASSVTLFQMKLC